MNEDISLAVSNAAKDITVALDYHFHNRILHQYGGPNVFRLSVRSFWYRREQNNNEFSRYVSNFPNIIDKLCPYPRINGKLTRIAKLVEKEIREKYRVVGKRDLKNGYSHRSFIMISESHIDNVVNNKNLTFEEKKPLSDYFSESQKRMIRKLFKTMKKSSPNDLPKEENCSEKVKLDEKKQEKHEEITKTVIDVVEALYMNGQWMMLKTCENGVIRIKSEKLSFDPTDKRVCITKNGIDAIDVKLEEMK